MKRRILKHLKEGSVGKRDGPTKEEESWRITTNNKIQDTLQMANIVQFIVAQIKMVWTY
jgi:hypothetical protein